MAFSPDGQTLAAGGNKGTIRVWDLNIDNAIQPTSVAIGPISGPQNRGVNGVISPCR